MRRYEPLFPLLNLDYCEFQSKGVLTQQDIDEAEMLLGKPLPNSFKAWLVEVDDNVILYGKDIYPLMGEKGTECIVYATELYREHGWPIPEDLLIFAYTSWESFWAFDMSQSINGESPVIEICPAADVVPDQTIYMLWHSSFERFIWTLLLCETRDSHPDMIEYDEYDLLWWEIQKITDPGIIREPGSVYEHHQTLDEIRKSLQHYHE